MGSGALSGKILLVRIVGNNKFVEYFRAVARNKKNKKNKHSILLFSIILDPALKCTRS